MGIFDFLKNVGKKLPKDADVAAELQKSVSAMDLDIQNLHVAFEKGTATLRGEAATQKDLELARLVVGNHDGVEKVNDDELKVVPRAAVPATPAAPSPAAQHAAEVPFQATAAGMAMGAGASAAAGATGRMYTVKSGDTLSRIAKETLGDANKYQVLFEANRPMIRDPDEIYPGQVLRIPPSAEMRFNA